MEAKNFDGVGHSQQPLEPQELAKHRQMFNAVNDDFIFIGSEDIATIKMITPIRKAWPFIAIVFGLAVAAVKQGII